MIDNFDNLNNIVDCYRWPTLYFLPFVSLCWWWCQLFVCAWSYVSSESCWSRITGESRQSINLSGPQAHYSHGVHYFQWNPKRVDNCFFTAPYALICNHIFSHISWSIIHYFKCHLIPIVEFQETLVSWKLSQGSVWPGVWIHLAVRDPKISRVLRLTLPG